MRGQISRWFPPVDRSSIRAGEAPAQIGWASTDADSPLAADAVAGVAAGQRRGGEDRHGGGVLSPAGALSEPADALSGEVGSFLTGVTAA
jgi:hypothetical protein